MRYDHANAVHLTSGSARATASASRSARRARSFLTAASAARHALHWASLPSACEGAGEKPSVSSFTWRHRAHRFLPDAIRSTVRLRAAVAVAACNFASSGDPAAWPLGMTHGHPAPSPATAGGSGCAQRNWAGSVRRRAHSRKGARVGRSCLEVPNLALQVGEQPRAVLALERAQVIHSLLKFLPLLHQRPCVGLGQPPGPSYAPGTGVCRNGGTPSAGAPSVMQVLKRWATWLRDNRRVVSLAAVIIGSLATAWLLTVPVADWLATHDVGQVIGPVRALRLQTARDAARGRLLTLGAGLFAVGALWFTARNFTLSRRTFELTEQGQVTDRYTKAIEQLGSDKLDVRIGGIYALERVARDSPRDHPTVIEVLAAFVREHSREQWPPAEPGAEPQLRTTRPDVQAAVTVIGRRHPAHDQQQINLAASDLTHANLTGTDLTNVNLFRANLGNTALAGADLSGTNLGSTDLTGADLSRANLTGALLATANLYGALLISANLTDASLIAAKLTRANLLNADLTGANLFRADLSAAVYSDDRPLPEGWVRDPGSGRLGRAREDTGDAGH
jgi:Pentapeptide repeats (8 copies)